MTDHELRDAFPDDRLASLDGLQSDGHDPYPPAPGGRDLSLGAFATRFEDEDVADIDKEYRLAGRVIRINDLGGIAFIDLRDASGTTQVMAREGALDDYDALDHLQLGDTAAFEGPPTRSDTGELSLDAREWEPLTKALRHPAWAAHDAGFDEQNQIEERTAALQLRDLHETIRGRFRVQRAVRDRLERQGFLEVETPILHRTAGGANAQPFETRAAALDDEMVLRIAPELYLKRLLAGGFDRVFEMGRVFRNEDIDTSHNPEFTMLEAYAAYATYEDMMELTEELVAGVAEEVIGTTQVTVDGVEVDLSPPWKRVDFEEAISRFGEINASDLSGDGAVAAAAERGLVDSDASRATALVKLYDEVAEPEILAPTFVTHHPVETTPLCEPLPSDADRLQRFEAVVGGNELANAYTELRDPLAQAEAFRQQVSKTGGEVDMEYVEALANGMPPAAGLGLGIDRLAMTILERESLKDVIAFPMTGRC